MRENKLYPGCIKDCPVIKIHLEQKEALEKEKKELLKELKKKISLNPKIEEINEI